MNSDRIAKKNFYLIIRNFSEKFVENLVEKCLIFLSSIFHEYLTRSFQLLSITLAVFIACFIIRILGAKIRINSIKNI
jgi:hypothetical protein